MPHHYNIAPETALHHLPGRDRWPELAARRKELAAPPDLELTRFRLPVSPPDCTLPLKLRWRHNREHHV